MISKVQGDSDGDIDAYAQKLSKMIKKKLKMYQVLDQRIDNFLKNLTEEDEISKKVKNTLLDW